jgi:ABC-2 type transport system permease protein
MRNILVIAAREYRAAVRTKSFIISLLLMPVLMLGSAGVQAFFKRQSDIKDRSFAVIDRSSEGKLGQALKEAADKRNQTETIDPETGQKVKSKFLIELVKPSPDNPKDISEQRLRLSNEVREDKYYGFIDVGPDVRSFRSLASQARGAGNSAEADDRSYLRYQTNHATYEEFPRWAERQLLLAIAGITAEQLEKVKAPTLRREGLSQLDPATGQVVDPPIIHLIARYLVPAALVAIMFMIVMLSSTPTMHGVVEEKMQRIAEVLLGSVTPFTLMMGKLLGLMAVSLTVAGVYIAGAYWAAGHYGLTEFLPVPLLAWFLVYQALAVLMFGSLFLAIGAAATDIKETQTLALPVILVCCIPMFILGTALDDPNHPMVVALSFFPLVTPMLMIARQAISPGPPWWQPVLGVMLVLAATTLCVYAAGRIFRVGILVQGKGARLGQLLQWVVRG